MLDVGRSMFSSVPNPAILLLYSFTHSPIMLQSSITNSFCSILAQLASPTHNEMLRRNYGKAAYSLRSES
jgi:hypothetical protein